MLPASNGLDDTAVINASLAAGPEVTGLPGETYLISAPLDLQHNGTHLSLSVTLLPGSNCNMVRNASGGRLAGVTISGGTWDRGANAGTGNDTHSLFLRGFDRLTVRDLRVTSTAGKYGLAIGDATEVWVRDLSFATHSDGVHITGPAHSVDIRGITGTTGDDMVALTARDYVHYDDVRGDITGVTIDGVYPDGSLAAVKIVSGTGTAVRGVSVRAVYGTTQIHPVAIMTDQTGPTVADGITIADLDVQCLTPAMSPIWIRAVTSTDITIRDVRIRRPLTGNPMILIDTPGGVPTRIGSLLIDSFLLDPGAITQAHIVGVYGTAYVAAIRMAHLRIPTTIGWTGLPVKVAPTATVVSVFVSDTGTITY